MKTLIIPDIHQDVGFLRKVLAHPQARNVQDIVLLGDILDGHSDETRHPQAIESTLRLIRELEDDPNRDLTLIWGNHDWDYWMHRNCLPVLQESRRDAFVYCALHSMSMVTLESVLSLEESSTRFLDYFGQKAQLLAARNGFLLSHAGLYSAFWPTDATLEAGVQQLNTEMRQVAETASLNSEPHPLTLAGMARGGDTIFPGPLWMDWDAEFFDWLEFPQIVGHSAASHVRQIDRSYCLDASQTAFGILGPEGLRHFSV